MHVDESSDFPILVLKEADGAGAWIFFRIIQPSSYGEVLAHLQCHSRFNLVNTSVFIELLRFNSSPKPPSTIIIAFTEVVLASGTSALPQLLSQSLCM